MNAKTKNGIKKWLKCPYDIDGWSSSRCGHITRKGIVYLYSEEGAVLAIFTIASLVTKRGAKRKKKAVRK